MVGSSWHAGGADMGGRNRSRVFCLDVKVSL